MSLVVPHTGEVQILTTLLNVSGVTLRLFSNNITVTVSTVKADITQVTGGGYAAITLTGATWTYSSGTPSRATYPTFLSFTFSGATGGSGNIYGYYVLDGSTNLLWAENITPVIGVSSSTVVPISLSLSLKSVQQ